MSKIGSKPVMFIDQKKSRIRIYKRTLHMLGDPQFIQLLVNPESLAIAIRPALQTDDLAHRVRWQGIMSKYSYELHSRFLIHRLQDLCKDWEYGKSYRLYGEMILEENLVRFDLEKALPSQHQKGGKE